MKIKLLIACVSLVAISYFITAESYAAIYTWTDSSGVVHFSDEERPGAKQVVLPPVQTTSSIPSSAQSSSASPKAVHTLKNNQVVEHKPYEAIQITAPANNETIRNAQGNLTINVTVAPELQESDKLQVLFDGQPLGKPQSSLSITLTHVNRGSHTLAVAVVSATGETLLMSEVITIYMQPPRVNM